MTLSDKLEKEALEAITITFSDTSVSRSVTKKILVNLRSEIDTLIDTLED